jgi:hypothetical protein
LLAALASVSGSSLEGPELEDPSGGSQQGIKTGRTYAEALCSSSDEVAVSVGPHLLSSQEIDLLPSANRFELGNNGKDARTTWEGLEWECGRPVSLPVGGGGGGSG